MMKDRFDIHQHITNQIITSIENGAGDIQLPWHQGGMVSRPTNIASKKAYRGVNIVALWTASQACGFSSGVWGAHRQWSEAGAQVRKGEKSSYVVFYRELEFARAEDAADSEAETRLFARATPVFAAKPVEGFSAEPPVPSAPRAKSACPSPIGATHPSAAAASPKPAIEGDRHALLRRNITGPELTAFQNLPIGALLTRSIALLGPATAPLSP